MKNNKYSQLKILQFPEKLESFRHGYVTPPIYVRVKPTNKCNHDCFFCVYAQSNRKETDGPEKIEHIKSEMHTDMVEKDTIPTPKMMEILDDFSSMGVKAVTYSGGGEPLFHPGIVQMMNRTTELGIDLSIITNGQLLAGERAQALAKAKWVRVSIDYTNGEEMAASRRVPERLFDGVIENLTAFAKIKSANCDLAINYIVHRNNCDNLIEIAVRLKECGVENVRFSPMWIPEYESYHAPIKDHVEAQLKEIQKMVDAKFGVNVTYNISDPSHSPVRTYHKCWVMQTVPVIGADLNVYACHNKAYDAKGKIGSIRDRRFKDFWFSQECQDAFNHLDPIRDCKHQCANDGKNLLVNEILSTSQDNFV